VVVELDLMKTNMGPRGAAAIAAALSGAPLPALPPGDDEARGGAGRGFILPTAASSTGAASSTTGAAAAGASPPPSSLAVLHLHGNHVGDEGAASLAAWLRGAGDGGAASPTGLVGAFSEGSTEGQPRPFSSKPQACNKASLSSRQGAVAGVCAGFIKRACGLVKLDLGMNGIGDAGGLAIAAVRAPRTRG
jgi:hypothetical protein